MTSKTTTFRTLDDLATVAPDAKAAVDHCRPEVRLDVLCMDDDSEGKYAIDAHDNICFWTNKRYLTVGGVTWISPFYWEAQLHIEEVTPLPNGLVWIRGKYLYTGADYTREEWEARKPTFEYIVARQDWLDACRRAPVFSKIWDFDNNMPPLTAAYPFTAAERFA